MALFTMRDSWNVWRRKVNEALGGMVEPVKSEDVTYDGTTSGLSATNVQSAIDEVAGDIGDLDGSDIAYDNTASGLTADDVQEAIDEVAGDVTTIATAITGSYVLDSIGTIEHEPATETYGAAMKDIGNQFKALVEADTTDSIYIPFKLFLAELATTAVALSPATKNNVPDQFYVSGGNSAATLQTIFKGSFKTNNTDGSFGITINNGSTSNVSYTDKSADSASTTDKSYLYYFKFKKI